MALYGIVVIALDEYEPRSRPVLWAPQAESAMQRVIRYQPLLVVMHWLLALMIPVALAGGALVLVRIPNTDPMKVEALRQHVAGGLLLLVLMLIRLIVRVWTTHPARASTGRAGLDRMAWLSHRLLYALVLGQAASGLYLALQAGLPSVLFGGHGALPPDFWVFPIRRVHYVLSRLLMGLIALHVAGALYHTFILRDGLLRRMWFGRRVPASRESLASARGRWPS
jgi:cytochrome b561